MIAPSSETWGKFLYSKYTTTGGRGEIGDWNQQVWVTESLSPVGQKKERNNSFFFMIACFRFKTDFFSFEYTSYYRN